MKIILRVYVSFMMLLIMALLEGFIMKYMMNEKDTFTVALGFSLLPIPLLAFVYGYYKLWRKKINELITYINK